LFLVDGLYSFCLGVAIVAAAVALLLALTGRTSAARRAASVSLGFALAASLIHVTFGHRPGTPAALTPLPFVREHPTLVVVGAISLVLLVWAKGRRPR
jgi:hypothetical protein